MLQYEEFLKECLDKIRFEDVFDLEELQEMQDLLANSLDIGSVITDLNGKPITQQSNFCSMCQNYVRQTESGLKQCMRSDASMLRNQTDGYTIAKCTSAGLLDAGVTLKLKDKRMAYWMFGQVKDEYEVFEEQQLRNKARELGVDEEEFVQAYKEVPIMERKKFEDIARLIYLISRQLSEQAYQRCMSDAEQRYRVLLDDEMERQKEIAEHASYIDGLTKLNNRSYFDKQAERLDFMEVVPVAVIVGDVNNLKLTNDIFGHRHGDILLSTIADVLQQESFDDFVICRCGGDEFYILIPNANRQAADWYCRRVRLELDKKFNCCVKPSVAFGVAKKSNKQEKIKTIMEFADIKMYRDKQQIKEKDNLLDNMKQVLLGRGFVTPDYFSKVAARARGFGEYLGMEEPEVKLITRVVRLQDYGYLPLAPEVYETRFEEGLSIEQRREIMKHPTLSSRIAKVDENYIEAAEYILAHEEHWDGTGYPNELAGEEIPVISRIAKIVGDYQIAISERPAGRGWTEEEAQALLEKESGKVYDPEYVGKFLSFLAYEKERNQKAGL